MRKLNLSYIQMIAMGFLLIIIIGGLLLSLPIATRDGVATPIIDSLYTATSATCVTGLVIYDTYVHWSMFGQLVILILLQIGGLGFMTVATLFSIFFGRKIGLRERQLLRESVNTMYVGGIVRLVRNILFATFIFEGLGALLLCLRFCPQMGLKEGIYYAVFHSVSAFCNAGFDLMGRFGEFSSLTTYAGDGLVNIVMMALIIIGGLGFFCWEDIRANRFNLRKYRLHTKIVLVTSACLIVIPALAIFLIDQSLKEMGTATALLASFFQSVTARTAGFNTVDISALSGASAFLLMVLMIIGGSPGSTSGGIKTTTFATLVMTASAVVKGRDSLWAFRRHLDDAIIRRSVAVFFIYMALAFLSAVVLGAVEDFPLTKIFFEIISAMGTVGLSLGITPELDAFAKIWMALLMYFGRVGVLSIILTFVKPPVATTIQYPSEKILIG